MGLQAERLKELKNSMWLFKSTRGEADEMDAHLTHDFIASLWCTDDDDSKICDKGLLGKKIIKAVRDGDLKAIVEYYDSDSGGYVEIKAKTEILKITDEGYIGNHNHVKITIYRDDFKAWLISSSQWPLRAGCLLNYWYKGVSQFILTQATNDSAKTIKAKAYCVAAKKKHHSLMAWAECQRLFNSIYEIPIFYGDDWPRVFGISELAAMQTIDNPEKRYDWLLALSRNGNLETQSLKVTRNVIYGEREKILDFVTPSAFAEYLKSIGETPSRLAAAWFDAYGIDIEMQAEAVRKDDASNQISEKTLTVNLDSRKVDDCGIDEKLAALFDPISVAALSKMFPPERDDSKNTKKWENWQNNAKENGLIEARQGRGKFNPYKAGRWFLNKNIQGWDNDRLMKKLANNLPPRSLDEKHLLTGEFD